MPRGDLAIVAALAVAACAGGHRTSPRPAAGRDGPAVKDGAPARRPPRSRGDGATRAARPALPRPGRVVPRADWADAVWYANVVTLEERPARAEAVAVVQGRIVYVGDRAGAAAWVGPDTAVHDHGAAALYPGFTDAHGHLLSLGQALSTLDLRGTRSFADVVKAVQTYAANRPAGWVLGRGWDQNTWRDRRFPTRAALDAVTPGRPVLLTRVDGHAVLANGTALQIAGVRAGTPDPAGGRIVRDAAGAPTGLLVDNAVSLVTDRIPPPSEAELRERGARAVERLLSLGVTAIHDAGVGGAELAALEAMARAGELRVRVYALVDAGTDAGLRLLEGPPRVGLYDDRLSVRAVKLFADGALGSRGAALTDDYADDPGNRGLRLTGPGELLARVKLAHARGWQVAVHAIGDAAVRTTLDAYEAVFAGTLARAAAGKAASPRPRIEHAQVVDPEDRTRMAAMQVVASMQPVHATSDMPWAEDRLGPRRTPWAYAWRSVLDGGIPLAFGSDCPVESPDPRLGLYAAITRQDAAARPAGGWTARERIPLPDAVRAYTSGAAWAAFEEDARGTVAVGKRADFTVFDADLEAVAARAPAGLLKVKVVATVVGGRVEWPRRASTP